MISTRRRPISVPKDLNFLAPVVVDDLVRVGRRNDGGYVVSRAVLEQIDILLSFGVSEDWSFEAGLLKVNPQATIHAYDHSISHAVFVARWKAWLRRAAQFDVDFKSLSHRYNLPSAYLNFFQGQVTHFQQRVVATKTQPHDVRIEEIFARVEREGRIFVKMDIEGGEYGVMDEILQRADDIVGLAVEFHDIGPHREDFLAAVTRVQQAFDITHVHANNYGALCEDGFPDCIEVTFEKRRPGAVARRRTRLPIAIDQPNKRGRPDYVLEFDHAADGPGG
jgi:hypothetical protein